MPRIFNQRHFSAKNPLHFELVSSLLRAVPPTKGSQDGYIKRCSPAKIRLPGFQLRSMLWHEAAVKRPDKNALDIISKKDVVQY